MRRLARAFALLVALAAAPAAEAKVLVIGLDGTRWDKLGAAMEAGRAPNLKALMARGFGIETQLDYTPPAAFTVSEVGWSTIAAGVNPAKHMVTGPLNMDPDQANKNGHPDFLSQIERLAPQTQTFFAADWGNLGLAVNGGPIFSDAVDVKHATDAANTIQAWDDGDEAVTNAAVGFLGTGTQDAGFVYLGVIDEAAHIEGSATPAYDDAIARTDVRVGRVLAAARGWTVIVTTDHGQQDLSIGLPISHGGPSALERTSFIIAAGPGIVPGARAPRARIVDVHPTVLARVGLPGDAGLDGLPFALSTVEEANSFFGLQRANHDAALRRARSRARRAARAGAGRRGPSPSPRP